MIGFGTILALTVGSLVLGALAVLIDRLNFPQRPFRPRTVELTNGRPPGRDRTGAHVVYENADDDVTTGASGFSGAQAER